MSTQTKHAPVHSRWAANSRVQEWVEQHPNTAYPSDIIHDAEAKDFVQSMRDRCHYVDESDPNWITVTHHTKMTYVKFPRNKPGEPYTITMRARIARALKLMLFFALGGVLAYAHFVAGWL